MAGIFLRGRRLLTALVLLGAAALGAGCHAIDGSPSSTLCNPNVKPSPETPHELCKAVLPPYVIEPPDILSIDVVHIVPKAPYQLRPLDVLAVNVRGTLPDAPIDGNYRIEPGGFISLGAPYGSVQLGGVNLEDAAQVVHKKLTEHLRDPQVSVTLIELAAMQQVAGEHLVAPDGTVTLGAYGSVFVVGKTVEQARFDIQAHLAQFLDAPEVSLNIYAYNSKVYYVITQGAGSGDSVYRFPITGNETVLDAISQIEGLGPVSSKKIWVARPGCSHEGCDQVMIVDWNAITQTGSSRSNYQLMPGDRVYVAEDSLIALDSALAKIISPMERVFGITLLGTGTVTRLSGRVLQGGGNVNANF